MKKVKKNVILIVLLTVIILFFLLKDQYDEIINILLSSNIKYILLMFLMYIIGDLLKGISFNKIVKETNRYSFKEALLLTLQTNFFNGITPFSLGGQPFQLYFLKKRSNVDYVTGVNVLFKDFYTYQISLIILSIIFIILNYIYGFIVIDPLMSKMLLIGFTMNFVIALILIYLPYSKNNGKGIVNFFIKLLNKMKLIKDKEKALNNANESILKFKDKINTVKENKKLIFECVVLNMIKLTTVCLVSYFGFMAISVTNVSALVSIIAVTLVITMASFVPIPGASGGIEYGFIALFTTFVVGPKLNAGLLLWRFMTYYLPLLVGGIVFMFESRRD